MPDHSLTIVAQVDELPRFFCARFFALRGSRCLFFGGSLPDFFDDVAIATQHTIIAARKTGRLPAHLDQQ
jgi:hypothetical protein